MHWVPVGMDGIGLLPLVSVPVSSKVSVRSSSSMLQSTSTVNVVPDGGVPTTDFVTARVFRKRFVIATVVVAPDPMVTVGAVALGAPPSVL